MSTSANDLEIQQNPGVGSMVVYRRLAALLSKFLSAQTFGRAQLARP
jgi:hypothetical protein